MFEIVNYGWNDHVIFKMTMENSAVNQSNKLRKFPTSFLKKSKWTCRVELLIYKQSKNTTVSPLALRINVPIWLIEWSKTYDKRCQGLDASIV